MLCPKQITGRAVLKILVHFAKGNYNGRLLANVAAIDPAYLGWMLRSDFFEDTKALVSDALAEHAGAPD